MRIRPTFQQGSLIVLGGVFFAFFGCLGAIRGGAFTSNGSSAFVLGGLVFAAGVLAALFGMVVLVIAFFKAVFAKRDGES